MKKFKPTLSKFIRVSDIFSLTEENTEEILSLIRKTFGEGFFSEENISSVLSFTLVNYSGNNFLNIRIQPNKTFSFLDKTGLSNVISNEASFISKEYDDYNRLNGSLTSPIIFPKNLFSFKPVTRFGNQFFSFLFVNGTPQYIEDISSIEVDDNIQIGLLRVRGGFIYPSPINKFGVFDERIVTGITWLDFKNSFCDQNLNCYLNFGFLNIPATNKYLAVKISNTGQEVIYHVPKNYPIYETGIYYQPSPENPNTAIINLSKLSIDDSSLLNFFFVEEAFPGYNATQTNVVVGQYSLRFDNLLPESASSAQVLALDEQEGKLINLSNLNSLLGTNIYTLIPPTGKLQLNTAYLPSPQSKVFVGEYFYSPPLRIVSNSDYMTNVTLFGPIGSSVSVQTIPQTFHLYIKNITTPSSGLTYYDANSNSVSQVGTYSIRPHFLISENVLSNSDYIYGGQITLSPPGSVTYAPSTNILIPYQRLLSLAQSVQSPPQWRSVSLYKEVFNSGSNNFVQIPLLPVVQLNGKVTSVKSILAKLKVYTVSGTTNIDIPFSLDLKLIDSLSLISQQTLGNSLYTGTSQIFQFNADNIFSSSTILSLSYDDIIYNSPIFYLEFSTSTTNFFVEIDYLIVYYEIY